MGAVELGQRADQGLAAAVLGRGAVVQDQRRGADPERGPEVLRARAGWRQVGQVPDHRRPPLQAVLLLQPLGDPVRDGDHRGAAGNDPPLERADQPVPGARVVRDAGGELVRVVDQARPGPLRDEPAGGQHRRVVRVDDVGPHARGDAGDARGRQRPPRSSGKPLGPRRRVAGAELVSLGGGRRRVGASRQVDDDDLVARLGQRAGLAAHAGVVLDGLVEQHRDSHALTIT